MDYPDPYYHLLLLRRRLGRLWLQQRLRMQQWLWLLSNLGQRKHKRRARPDGLARRLLRISLDQGVLSSFRMAWDRSACPSEERRASNTAARSAS